MKSLIALFVLTTSLLHFSFAQKPNNGKDGTIKVKKTGKPMVVVSPTAMNVLYIGVDNPLDIAVGGYTSDYSVTISNGSLIGENGKYIAKVSGGTTSEVFVHSKNGKQLLGTFKFRVKRVPDPVAKFAGVKGAVSVSKAILVNTSGVIAEMENFEFDLKFEIVSFDVTISTFAGFIKTETSNSNKITPAQNMLILSVKLGGKLYIENIKAKAPDGSIRPLSPISIKVM